MRINRYLLTVAALLGGATLASAQEPVQQPQQLEQATAELTDTTGQAVGTVTLTQIPSGGVHVAIEASGLTPGAHAIHIHQTGQCEPAFAAAGGHFAPRGRDHGWQDPQGTHAGDLLNIHVGEDGSVSTERLAPHVSLVEGEEGSLFDEDGSAIVIHGGADDYTTQPSGGSGDPVACGVVQR